MIKIDSLLYKIDQRLNKLSSNAHQEIPLEDKILALNEAQISLIKTKLDGFSVPNKLGMDANKKRYEDIENLIVDYSKNTLSLVLGNPVINQYDAKISELQPKYMFYADAYILADKGPCKDHKVWINKDLLKHGDLQFFLNNTNYAPSFEYQETFLSITGEIISIYTDGTFTPTKLHLMYVRYPAYIDKAGYVDFDGKASVNRDSELKDYLEDELLDVAVLSLSMYTENMSAAQSAQARIMTNE
jgi:hypothetical protein